jgi:hypothetical protein
MDWMTPLVAVLSTGSLIWLVTRSGLKVKPRRRDTALLCCSFCGKSQREVRKLIAGPEVQICGECVGLCDDILAEEIQREGDSSAPQPASPPPPADERERLLGISDGLSRAAHTMRRVWIIEDSEAATIIHEMSDRIAALARALREEISR